jgi:hypothetical protein
MELYACLRRWGHTYIDMDSTDVYSKYINNEYYLLHLSNDIEIVITNFIESMVRQRKLSPAVLCAILVIHRNQAVIH